MSSLDFSRRSTADELMDTEPVDFEVFRAWLVDLMAAADVRWRVPFRLTVERLKAR